MRVYQGDWVVMTCARGVVVPTVTLDTNIDEQNHSVLLVRASRHGYTFAYAVTSLNEVEGTSFEEGVRSSLRVPDIGRWGELRWDESRWPNEASIVRLLAIEKIIAGGPLPEVGLTDGQINQRRDAAILEAHVAAGRDVFLTLDRKAFISHGRREQLETLLQTRILTIQEFELELARA